MTTALPPPGRQGRELQTEERELIRVGSEVAAAEAKVETQLKEAHVSGRPMSRSRRTLLVLKGPSLHAAP